MPQGWPLLPYTNRVTTHVAVAAASGGGRDRGAVIVATAVTAVIVARAAMRGGQDEGSSEDRDTGTGDTEAPVVEASTEEVTS